MSSLPKDILKGKDAREAVLNGVNQLADCVAATMGIAGRNVLIEKDWYVQSTMDGVSVAKEINLPDKFENMGASLVKEAAEKTNRQAGDGTTTATVLARELMTKGLKAIEAGNKAILVKQGMREASDAICAEIEARAKPVKDKEDIRSVAFISSRDDDIADTIAEVMDKVGNDGAITIEHGRGLELEVEYTEGIQFNKGWVSPYFITHDNKRTCELEGPYILVYDGRITNQKDLLPIMQMVAEADDVPRSLMVICDEIGKSALGALLLNHKEGNLPCLAVAAPEFGDRRKDFLMDIAAVTGANFISPSLGEDLSSVTLGGLGRAGKVVASIAQTTIIDGRGTEERINKRIDELRQFAADKKNSEFEQSVAQERIARLTNGIAVLKVGAATDIELQEKLHRVEDALGAARSAAEMGVVPGGGVAYIRAAGAITMPTDSKDKIMGYKIVLDSLEACTQQIIKNSESSITIDQVKKAKGNNGYNSRADKITDLMKDQVIDPAKVCICALKNAVSVASMFLTTEVVVADIKPEEQDRGSKYCPGCAHVKAQGRKG